MNILYASRTCGHCRTVTESLRTSRASPLVTVRYVEDPGVLDAFRRALASSEGAPMRTTTIGYSANGGYTAGNGRYAVATEPSAEPPLVVPTLITTNGRRIAGDAAILAYLSALV